jgi:pimeloyl-ACP methyl ester carboxylesterase
MQFIRKINKHYLSLSIWVRLLISTFIVSLFIISTQNLHIFPGAVMSIFNGRIREVGTLPNQVESIFVNTKDGKELELWRLPTSNPAPVAVIFHGNAGDVENFFPYQKYFHSIGITSYGFDYRGYGKSSGWPSEQGLKLDTRAVLDYVRERESISDKDLIIVGISIGSGPASFGATEFKPGALILFSPFISLVDAVKAVPLLEYLHPFTLYEFPVKMNVGQLSNSCLIVAHGEKDNVIPFAQGREVFSNYHGNRFSSFILSPEASHNDILLETYDKITLAIQNCFKVE